MNEYIPVSVNLDKTCAVGKIDIVSGTTQTGGRTYDVPIKVPSGMHNFQPELSLSYNSQQGNSLLGIGWTLNGLSKITRTPQTLHYNNNVAPVSLDNEDCFMLDGCRLILTSGGDNEIIYETEQGNIRVKGYSNGDQITSFTVYYPDGRKAEFGNPEVRQNPFSYLTYLIREMSDPYGNTILYEYEDFNVDRIASISYNGASIEFEYADRQDIITTYGGGDYLVQDKLLTKIVCKNGNSVTGEYDLSYSYWNSTSELQQIDYSVNGKNFNPLEFYYGEDYGESFVKTKTQLIQWHTAEKQSSIKAFTGRFDYESGEDGLISVPNHNPYWESYDNGWHYKNMFDGTETILLYADLSEDYPDPYPNLKTEEGFVDILCADLYGNQQDCVVKINNTVSNGMDKVTFHIYGKESVSGMRKLFSRTYSFPTVVSDGQQNSVHPKFYYTGDFDGDGRIEIMAISAHQPAGKTNRPSILYVFDLLNDEIKYQEHLFSYDVELVGMAVSDPGTIKANSDRLIIMDFDGDGKTDIGHLHANGITLYSFDVAEGNFVPKKINTNIALSKTNLRYNNLYSADVNGDGMMDLIITPATIYKDEEMWSAYYSMGDGHFQKKNFSFRNVFYNDDTAGALFRDVNGDGRTDLITFTSKHFDTTLSDNSFNRYEGIRTYLEGDSPSLIPLDLNSHNYSTHLSSLRNGVLTKYSSQRDDSKNLLLTGVVNSLGIVEKTEYKHLSEGISRNDEDPECFYTFGHGASYPYVNIREAIPVVSATETYQNGVKINEEKYTYKNAVVNRWGLGFCGFETITCQDIRGLKTIRTFEPYKYGMLKAESSPEHEISYANSFSGGGDKVLKLRTDSKKERDLLRNVEFSTSYSYDEYGNVINETTDYGDGLTVEKAFGYESRESIEDGYYIGFNTSLVSTTTRDEATFTEVHKVTDHEGLQPVTMIHSKNGGTYRTTEYTYDEYGNVMTESVRMFDSPNALVTSYEYDTNGYVINKTDPIGNIEEYTYDSLGRIETVTDKRGNVTTYVNDDFGRVLEIHYPDGRYEKMKYDWCSDESAGVYEVETTGNSIPMAVKTYDAKERIVRESDMRFNGVMRNVDKEYDNQGNVTAVSLPYTSGSPVLWNRYEYDDHNRLTYIDEASGRVTVYSYNGLVTKKLEDNVPTTKTYDVLGNLISVTDPGGTVTYNLNPDNQLSSMIAPGNIKTAIRYDSYGRRTSINDPSHGTTTWEYDNSGNVSSKVNAVNKTVSYEYDDWGHLIKETSPESVVEYVYDTFGDIISISSNNGTSLETKYDSFGRVMSTTETGLDGTWLKKDYTYLNGQMQGTKYTYGSADPITESYVYSNGHRSEVKINGVSSIYKLIKENNFGQPVEVQTGVIKREYEFDEYGLPTRRTAYMDDVVYQDISYTYDYGTNNLLSREDHGIVEEFEYDGLNRLRSYYNGGVGYDNKGNITSNKNIGRFFYDNALKPYAITSIEQTGSDIIPSGKQTVAYTSDGRPLRIEETVTTLYGSNQYKATLDYNFYHERVRMSISRNTIDEYLKRWYIGNCLEIEEDNEYRKKNISKLYLMGDYYSSPAVYKIENGESQLVYLLRDILGSITHVIDSEGELLQEVGFDAWGRICNPKTKANYSAVDAPKLLLGRGYTGHEHIPVFGLINMNARLYDPALGRMLSPDPYIQDMESTQNLNRYSYALNNPMKYRDPNGEFLWLTIAAITDLFKNVIRHGFDFDSYDFTKTKNAWKLDMGMFKGNFGQILNKLTWNAVNSGIGNTIAQGYNLFGRRGVVTDLDGMLCLSNAFTGGRALTFGHYSVGPMNYKADWRDHLFVHEYGHYIQAQRMGPVYTGLVALPSLISASKDDGWSGVEHSYRWFEQDASSLGAEYFDRKYGSGAEGYKKESENYFDVNKFYFGGKTRYINPRTGSYVQNKRPVSGGKNLWWDFAFILIII